MHEIFWRRRQYASLIPGNQKKIEVREYYNQLSENKGEIFHSVVKKLLFVMKSSRIYLETAMIFLTTRVSKSDVDDWEN